MKTRHITALVLAAALVGAGPQDSAKKTHPNEIKGDSTFAYKPGPEGAVRGDTVVLALLSDIDGFNPLTSSSAEAHEIHELIFPRLMHEQPDYNQGPPSFKPYIAESWKLGEDGLSIRFTLRTCTWSDGTPITSEDVRFSWEAAKSDEVAWVSKSIVDFIKDIEIHSPREFTARYTEKYPYQLMDVNDFHVIPKHTFGKIPFAQWQKHGRWEEPAKVSGGPWILHEYKPNQEITLVRNPKYYEEGKPYLDKCVFRIVGDKRTMITTVLAKGIDCMNQPSPKEAKTILDAGHLNLYTYVSRIYGYIGWNCKMWPFDDVKVRQAMTLATDRENMVESILYGYGTVAGPPIISSMWASNSNIKPRDFEPSKATKLLEEAGWKKNKDGILEKDGKPFVFTLVTNAGNDTRKQVCEYAQSDLAKIGVKAEIKLMDFNQMSQQLKSHTIAAWVGGWNIATKIDNKPIWHSSSVNGKFNYANYENKRVDEIIDTARVMSDFKAAKPLWDEFQVILDNDQPYTMVYEVRHLMTLDKRFRNVKATALRFNDNMHEWWVPKDEQRYK